MLKGWNIFPRITKMKYRNDKQLHDVKMWENQQASNLEHFYLYTKKTGSAN